MDFLQQTDKMQLFVNTQTNKGHSSQVKMSEQQNHYMYIQIATLILRRQRYWDSVERRECKEVTQIVYIFTAIVAMCRKRKAWDDISNLYTVSGCHGFVPLDNVIPCHVRSLLQFCMFFCLQCYIKRSSLEIILGFSQLCNKYPIPDISCWNGANTRSVNIFSSSCLHPLRKRNTIDIRTLLCCLPDVFFPVLACILPNNIL